MTVDELLGTVRGLSDEAERYDDADELRRKLDAPSFRIIREGIACGPGASVMPGDRVSVEPYPSNIPPYPCERPASPYDPYHGNKPRSIPSPGAPDATATARLAPGTYLCLPAGTTITIGSGG